MWDCGKEGSEVVCGEWSRGGPVFPEKALAQALAMARIRARRWARRLPAWMDREAFVSEALLAVVVAARRYRPERVSRPVQKWSESRSKNPHPVDY
jgi:hypothetical protein